MIYPIVVYGNAVLRKVAEPITPDYPELSTLLEDMFKTLKKSEGVGLAAPQIGFRKPAFDQKDIQSLFIFHCFEPP